MNFLILFKIDMRAERATMRPGSRARLRAPEALGFFMLKYAFSHFLDTPFFSFSGFVLTSKTTKIVHLCFNQTLLCLFQYIIFICIFQFYQYMAILMPFHHLKYSSNSYVLETDWQKCLLLCPNQFEYFCMHIRYKVHLVFHQFELFY